MSHSYLHTCYTVHPKGCHVPEHSVLCGRHTSSCQEHTAPALGSLNAQSSPSPSQLPMHFSPAARGTGLPSTTSSYVPPGQRNHQPPERDSFAQHLRCDQLELTPRRNKTGHEVQRLFTSKCETPFREPGFLPFNYIGWKAHCLIPRGLHLAR
ncbi:unnamed protein product [Eretmochelys imbricata]